MRPLKPALLAVIIGSLFEANVNSAETSVDFRFAHYDRDFTRESRDRTQTGASVILRHDSSLFNDKTSIKVGLYLAQKWAHTGFVTEDLLQVTNNGLTGFNQVGEASISFSPVEKLTVQVGRMKHESLLLKSKTRLLPSTFEGITITGAKNDITFYASQYRKWSRRANEHFNGFSTELNQPGKIKHVSVIGMKHDNENASLTIEALHADNYITKLGITGSYQTPIKRGVTLRTKAGLFSSHDAGELFVNGANSTLDIDEGQGAQNELKRIEHDGLGAYVNASLTFKYESFSHEVSLTHARFKQAWLERNFADDHGQSPFPTSTIGPELTNDNEKVWLLKYIAHYKEGTFSGIRACFGYANAYGVQNSYNVDLGTGNESWFEADFRYKPSWSKGLSFRLRFRDYNGEESGNIAGVKPDREETRLTLDYSLTF